MEKKRLGMSGVYVAMCSCYDANGRVDPAAVKRLTRYLARTGIEGVYVGGSTGEGILQTTDERKRVLEAVAEENDGRLKLIAHIGAATTQDSVELAKHAERTGVDATSAIPPFYYPYSEEAVKRYWLDIMDSADVPFVIYYIPGSTGFHLSMQLLEDLLGHPRLAGMKVTSFNVYELQQFKALGGTEFTIFNGPDQQYLAGLSMGADGGIGSTYGVMPELFVKIDRMFREGKMEAAFRWQSVVNEVITEMRRIGLFPSIKELLRLRGIDCGEPRKPLPSLDSRLRPSVLALHEIVMRQVELAAQTD